MSSTALIATIAVIAFLLFFFIWGFKRGFFKIILTTVSLFVTMIVAALLLQPATDFLVKNTKIETQMEERLEKRLGFKTTQSAEEKETKPADDQLSENIAQLEKLEGSADADSRAKLEESVIKGLSLPGLLKNSLIAKNNTAEYVKLGVENFKQYIVRSVAMLELKLITYVGLVVAIFIAIRILMLIAKVIEKIPLVKGANRFIGGVIGLIEGLFFIWLACMVISWLAQSEFGIQAVAVIRQSGFLSFLYENNLVLNLVNGIFGI